MPPGRFCRIYCNIPAQFGCFICFVLVLVLAARPTADYFLTRKRQIIAMTVSYWNFFLDDFLCLSLLRYAALCCGLRGAGLGDGAYLGLGLCLWLVGDRNIKLHDWLWWKETGHRNVFIDPFFSFCTPRLSINIYCYRITVRPWVFFWFLTKPFSSLPGTSWAPPESPSPTCLFCFAPCASAAAATTFSRWPRTPRPRWPPRPSSRPSSSSSRPSARTATAHGSANRWRRKALRRGRGWATLGQTSPWDTAAVTEERCRWNRRRRKRSRSLQGAFL